MLEKLPSAIGQALNNLRAGADKLAITDNELTGQNAIIEVTSAAFAYGEPIPARYTADGEGLSPPLEWRCVPTDAETVVMMVEDADSPTPKPLVHAIVWDAPGVDASLPEGALSTRIAVADESGKSAVGRWQRAEDSMGRNSYFEATYLPPDPPPGHGPHRYVFQVFALDRRITFDSPPGRAAIIDAMRDHVIAKGMLIGSYERP